MINIKFSTIFLVLLGLALLSPTTTYAQSGDYTIKGKVNNWKENQQVVLSYDQNGVPVEDTTKAVNGKFAFNGKLPEPVEVSVYLISSYPHSPRDGRQFFMEPGMFKLTAKDSLKYAEVDGTQVTRDHFTLEAQVNPLLKRMVDMKLAAMRIPEAERETRAFKQLEQRYKATIDSIQMVRRSFIKAHPNSFISLMAVKDIAGMRMDYNAANDLFESLSPAVKNTPTGKQLAAGFARTKHTRIGAILPDFTSLDTLRKPLSLSEVVQKGELTLVDFWASWCKPCREENPNVVRTYNTFHDKGFNILSVSLDQSEASWKKAIRIDGMPWYHVSSLKYWDEPVAKLYGIQGVPDSFLLDEAGKVIARGLKGEALYKAVETYFSNNKVDSVQLRTQAAKFDKEPTYEGKLQLYQQVVQNESFKKVSVFPFVVGGMEQDIAIHWAHQGQYDAFNTWYPKIQVPYLRRKAITEGFSALSAVLPKAQFVGLLTEELGDRIEIKEWDGEQVLIYQSLLALYLDFQSDNSEKIIDLMAPLYAVSGNFFPTDVYKNYKDSAERIGSTFSYRFANALFHKGDRAAGYRVLAQAVQSGAFTLDQIKAKGNTIFSYDEFAGFLHDYLDQASSDYSEMVKKLLSKNTLKGQPYDLKSFTGEYILLDFWGSWCLPCRFSHPKLKTLYEAYKDKGLEMISVAHEPPASMDVVKQKWQRAIKADQMDWVQILNNEGVETFDAVKAFMISSFPTKILLDKNLNKVEVFKGMNSTDQLAKRLEELMK